MTKILVCCSIHRYYDGAVYQGYRSIILEGNFSNKHFNSLSKIQ